MRMPLPAAIASALAIASCTRAPATPPAPPAPSSPVATATASAVETAAPVPTPAADANALDASRNAPPWTFAGFPGWIGYATNDERSQGESPMHASAEIAIPDPAWNEPGAVLRASAEDRYEWVTFATFEEARFGCDGNKAKFAFFDGEKRFRPGPVWMTPKETSATVAAVTEIPMERVPAKISTSGEKDLRAWSAGAHTFVARRTDATLVAEVWEGETRTFRRERKYIPMQGADDVAPSLQGGPGVPLPRLVISVEGKTLLLVESNGFEGVGFEALLLEKGSAKMAEGRPYLYWCAF